MVPCASVEELLTAPEGRYLSGRTWLFFCAPAGLVGTLVSGSPDEAAMRRLTEVYTAYGRMRAGDRPRGTLFDASGLEFADASSFRVLVDYFAAHAGPLAPLIDKLAVVHGGGYAGAVVAGFRDVVRLRPSVRVFAARADALAWLGHADADSVAAIDALARLLDGGDPWLCELRARLRGSLVDADAPRLARELGMSRRSLQRRLQDAGTSFQRELQRMQIEVASQRLVSTDEKVTAIALDVGCGTLQHFCQLFRRHIGETPTEFRRRHRGG